MDWHGIILVTLLFGSIPLMFGLGRLVFGPDSGADTPSRGDDRRHDPSRASNVNSAMQNDMGG